jgi:Lrp/AsnC family transcriptional regulator for asnA, asnC and gidA
MAAKLNLDKLDLQIIHHMMEDAQISYADLGKKLFVSGGTIHVRIKKLQEAGIVKNTKLNVDLKQLCHDVIAFIGIYLEKSSLYDSVEKELQKISRSFDSITQPAITACLLKWFAKTLTS